MAGNNSIEENRMYYALRVRLTLEKRISCIFDFLGIIAFFLQEKKEKFKRGSLNGFVNKPFGKKVKVLCDAFINISEVKMLSTDFVTTWIELIKNCSDEEVLSCCFYTLIRFDSEYEIPASSVIKPQKTGPLTNTSLDNALMMYLLPPKTFQSGYLKEKGIRKGRNTLEWDTSSPISGFNNYIFLKVITPGAKTIETVSYKPAIPFDNSLTIGLFPIGFDCWFAINKDDSEKTYTCSYDNQETNEKIISLMCEDIIDAYNHKCNIVVFPEMAAVPNCKDHIISFLMEHKEIKDCVSLIFLGTEWVDYSNTGCLISGSGTEILSVYKQKPFSMHVDGKEDDYYEEDLRGKGEAITLLDVEGLGRISWMICRDFLEKEMWTRCDDLGTGIYIISAFTKRLDVMNRVAEAEMKNGTITIISNKCTLSLDHSFDDSAKSGGCVFIPTVNENRCIEGTVCASCYSADFCKGHCLEQHCGWMLRVDEKLISHVL